ncbi:hypothetical protein GFS31_37230 [Leptolyngbya sp. BL0902]|nr:hypothetical protein GFS31_37230 [Leptolyngbya sp. BL0902]
MLAVWLAVAVMAWPRPAVAALKCQPLGAHRVCLESVKRSAKYFWQYQGVVSVDGTALPLETYDCRPVSAETSPATTPAMDLPDTAASPVGTGQPANLSAADLLSFVCQAVQPRR